VKVVNFVNLTNGIEFLPEVENPRFIRIKSTHFERHLLEDVIVALSDDLLMNLAIGNKCVIYDFGMYFEIPRSIWEGIPWIKYVLYRAWFGKETDYIITRRRYKRPAPGIPPVLGKEYHPQNYKVFFRNRYNRMSDKTMEKINYYKNFISSGTINLEGVSRKTEHDGDIDFYKKVLSENTKI
jgi:hypothetical protein